MQVRMLDGSVGLHITFVGCAEFHEDIHFSEFCLITGVSLRSGPWQLWSGSHGVALFRPMKILPHHISSQARRVSLARGLAALCCLVLTLAMVSSAANAREVVAGLYENEPKIFTAADGRAAGIFPELLDEIAAREGWQLRYLRCEWSACLAMLDAGEIDLMPDVAFSSERLDRFSFHESVALHSWSQIFKRLDSRIESILDLDGKRIAMLAGSVQEVALRGMLAGFDVQFEMVPADSIDEAFALVAKGAADAAVANHLFGVRKAPNYELVPAPIVFQPSRLFFATALGRNLDLLAGIDRQLSSLKADQSSAYFRILEKWAAPAPELIVPAMLRKALFVLLVLGLALGVIVIMLRLQVRARTRERERLAIEVSESEQRYRDLAENINDVIWTLDPETMRFTYVSPSVERIRGYTPEEVMSMPLEATLAPGQLERAQEVIARSVREFVEGERAANDAVMLEVEQTRRDGSLVWTEVVGNIARNRHTGKLEIRGVTRDITERRRNEARIQQLAHFDQLTGLPNRALLRDRFVQLQALAERHHRPYALLFLDLDHFKNINDTLGHDAGDQLLVEIAKRLEAGVRAGDTVCRLGGDEYIILLGDCDADGVAAVVRKLIETVSQPCLIGTHELVTTPSIGIAMYPDDGEDLDTLLRKADVAMYRVKRENRGDFRFYTNEMQAHTERALLLASALRNAVASDQLHLHFQPQFNVSTRQVTGVEALVRWTHPILGELSPAEFIPVAESTGLINEVGAWVLREAAREFKHWQTKGLAPQMLGVNLSAVQFRRQDLPQAVRRELDSAGIQPERLELELTEAVAMDDPENALHMMRQLAASGVRIAIDDFGTGYSSLSYLKRFTAHRLKIDRSFVRDIGEDEDDRAIVRAIIRLAQSLGMHTVAEGVETDEQLAFLKAEGCDEAQGYLLARPMPASEMRAFLAGNRALIAR